MKRFLLFILALAISAGVFVISSKAEAKKKVIYIDSYHQGYAWSDGIREGIEKTLGNKVELKVIYMDTKRNNTEEFKVQAGNKARDVINPYKPDLIIAADDNASRYVIVPFYKDKAIPVVFCGINWDASIYGFPCKNVTGMVEVAPYGGLIKNMSKCAKSTKLGFLAIDNETTMKEMANMKKVGMQFEPYLAKDLADWKKGFLKMQNEVGMLIIDSDGGLFEPNKDELTDFVMKNTKIITGSTYDFMAKYAIINFIKIAQEQGEWSAATALSILFDGKSPKDIPVTENKKGDFILNMKIAGKTDIKIPEYFLTTAKTVIK